MTCSATALLLLETALGELGDALAEADLQRLLAVEERLASAVDSVAALRPDAAGTIEPLAVERVREALTRCRRLGAGLIGLTESVLGPQADWAYGRGGAAPVRRTSIEARG